MHKHTWTRGKRAEASFPNPNSVGQIVIRLKITIRLCKTCLKWEMGYPRWGRQRPRQALYDMAAGHR